MAEEIRDDLVSILVDKKNSWGGNIENNFKLPNELTVEITLNEYRELIAVNGVYEKKLDEKQHEVWDKDAEMKKIREENEKLKNKILELMAAEMEEDKKEE